MKFSNITAALSLTSLGIPQLAGNRSKRKQGIVKDYPFDSGHQVTRNLQALSPDRFVALNIDAGAAFLGVGEVGDQAARAQVDSINVSSLGTVTGAGTLNVTITSAVLPGSPLTIPVAVKVGDTPTIWAGKVRNALSRNAAIAALYTVGGSTTSISLTRKIDLFGVPNDSTLNIALAVGSATGITTASTSTNTTSALEFVGFQFENGNSDLDAEGVANPDYDSTLAILITVERGEITITDTDPDDTEATPTLTTTITGPGAVALVRPVTGSTLYLKNTGTTTISSVISWAYVPA